jgi:4-hydroxybenzoyl-CoA thioesterase
MANIPVFQVKKPIRFGHCDPAGVAFYPQLVGLCHEAVEDWLEACGWSYSRLHNEAHLTVPITKMAFKFHNPCHLGDVLVFGLTVKRLSDRSVDIALIAGLPGQLPNLTFEASLMLVDYTSRRSKPWPDDLKTQLAAWQPPEG